MVRLPERSEIEALLADTLPVPAAPTVQAEQAAFEAWCPYKGSPDPRVVWAAAWKAALTAREPATSAEEQSLRVEALNQVEAIRGDFEDATALRVCIDRLAALTAREPATSAEVRRLVEEIRDRVEHLKCVRSDDGRAEGVMRLVEALAALASPPPSRESRAPSEPLSRP